MNRCFEPVHPPQRRLADANSVRGKSRAMARANKLILLLVSWHRATEMGTNRSEHTKPALTVFRYIDRFFGYRFAPAIHQLNLNGAHHGLGQGRKFGQCSHWRLFEFGGAAQERKQREANQWHRKQGSDKEPSHGEQRAEKRAPALWR